MSITDVIERMEQAQKRLPADDGRRYFHQIYLRTTQAVARELDSSGFLDRDWVERWDVAFADLYVDALDRDLAGERPPGPWGIVFTAAADGALPPLRQTLLGLNAHINYDLPQAIVAVMTPEDFDDPSTVERRRADHERIDGVLAARVSAEDAYLASLGGRSLLDRLLAPLNQLGTKRFLTEARRKVWDNARLLDASRRRSADAYQARLAELEKLSAARVADLRAPGQVIFKLAVRGFGVRLADTQEA